MPLYHKHSMVYLSLLLSYFLKFKFLRMTFSELLSKIERTSASVVPLVRLFGRQEVKKLLKQSGFHVEQLWVRKLGKEDLPFHYPKLASKLSPSILKFLSRYFGWYVITKVRKPKSL